MKRLMLLSLLLFLSGCNYGGNHRGGNPKTEVRLALTNVPLSFLPVIMAKQLNLFGQNGLNVEIEDFCIASPVMQAMLAGSADVAAETLSRLFSLQAMAVT